MGRIFLALIVMMSFFAVPSASQVAGGQWSGSIQCQLDVQAQGYVRQEVQTWTLTGAPAIAGGGTGIPVYAATWNYSGQGQLQRMDGSRATNAQWAINVIPGEAPLSIYVRDGVLIIKRASAQQKRYNGLNGQRQIAVNGVPQQATPMTSYTLWEWPLPWIEAAPGSNVSGTINVQTEGIGAEIQQPGPPPFAACKYQFTKGSASVNPVAQTCNVAQKFEEMKTYLAREYDALIQQDPSRRIALNAQKQRLLHELDVQEQQNIGQACRGGTGASTAQNSQGTGTGSAIPQNTGQMGAGSSPPLDTTAQSGGTTSQGPTSNTGNAACTLNDVAGMYDSLSQNLQVAFSKLLEEQRSEKNEVAMRAATGDQTARNQVASIDKSIAKLQTDEQKLLQEIASQKQKTLNQLAKAQIDEQRNTTCQAALNYIQQMGDVITLEIASLNSPGAGVSRTGADPATSVNSTNSSGQPSINLPPSTGSGSQTSSAPRLLKVEPASANQNTPNLQVALKGDSTHWLMGTSKLDFGPGITTVAGPFFTSATDAYVVIAVAPNATVGPRTVTVTSPYPGKTESVALPNSFNVTAESVMATMTAVPLNNLPVATLNPSTPPESNSTPPINVAALQNNRPTKQPKGSSTSTAPAAPAAGNYLVTITGLRAAKSVLDDPFDHDGKGDEIYAAVWIRQFDRKTGQGLMETNVRTLTYGDIRGASDRIQAGSLSPTGGIGDFDSIPPNFTADRCCAPSNSMFPLKVFEGTLTDGVDALVLSPSVWEFSGDQSWFYTWGQAQNQLTQSIFTRQEIKDQIDRKIFGPITLGATASNSGNNVAGAAASVIVGGLGLPLLGLPVNAITGGWRDRPIGLVPVGVDATALPNTTIVLTREIIETALNGPHQPVINAAPGVIITTPKPGIMVFNFVDTFKPQDWQTMGLGLGLRVSPGIFTMVLQVERTGSQASSTNSGTTQTDINAAMEKAADSYNNLIKATDLK